MKYLESVFHCNVCLPLVLYIDARNIKKTALHNINSMKLLICIRVGSANWLRYDGFCDIFCMLVRNVLQHQKHLQTVHKVDLN